MSMIFKETVMLFALKKEEKDFDFFKEFTKRKHKRKVVLV